MSSLFHKPVDPFEESRICEAWRQPEVTGFEPDYDYDSPDDDDADEAEDY